MKQQHLSLRFTPRGQAQKGSEMSKESEPEKTVTTAKVVAPATAVPAPAPVTKEVWWSNGKNTMQTMTLQGEGTVLVKFKDHKLTLDLTVPREKLISDNLRASSRFGLDFYEVKSTGESTDINDLAETLRRLMAMSEPDLKRLFDPSEFEKLGLPRNGGDRCLLIAAYMRSHVLVTK